MKHPSFFRLNATAAVIAASLTTPLASPAQTEPAAGEPVHLDEFRVSSDPFARNADELLQAASILSGQELDIHRSGTLGETLSGLPGVSSTSFGPGASRPIIRGLDGDRIRVLTNGVGTIDVSSTSPDHAVSVDPAIMKRAEIVRGPATLLYGSSAAGGIVNVIEDHIPAEMPTSAATGFVDANYGSVADAWGVAARVSGAASENLAWSASFARKEADDTKIPGVADLDHENEEPVEGFIPNSAVTTTSGAAGIGWFWESGRAGVSVSGYDTSYGVPGHAHHEEGEEHDADVEEEEDHGAVTIDLQQRRIDLAVDVIEPFAVFRTARLRAGFADYDHAEVEGDAIGTRFDKKGYEARLDLIHLPAGAFEGALGAQLLREETRAAGEEAFLPPTRVFDWALFALEEYLAGPVRWQLGARAEHRAIDVLDQSAGDRSKLATSFSGGALWTLSQEWTAAVSVALTQRNPTAQEWYANGPHAATRSFEIGNPDLGKEKSTSIDLNLRRRAGAITGAVSLFYTDYDRFIFANSAGEQEDGFAVYEYTARDARFYGAEGEITWHMHETSEHSFDLTLMGDVVRARNTTDDTDLPRIPPMRAGVEFAYANSHWTAGLDLHHAFAQHRVAPGEEPSDAYTLVGARLGYTIPAGEGTVEFYLRASNVLNELARPHTSYLRDVAPLPGRNILAGVHWAF